VAKDPDRARALLAVAAEEGAAPAQKARADMLRRGEGGQKDVAGAERWYAIAAEAGEPWAAFELARLYDEGAGVPAEPVRARALYRSAAEARVVAAQSPGDMLRMAGRCPDVAEASNVTESAGLGVPGPPSSWQ
jgi:TPR repeat protein